MSPVDAGELPNAPAGLVVGQQSLDLDRRQPALHAALVRTTPYERSDIIEGFERGEVEYALSKPEWDARACT
jgi:hypothetical protein